VELKINFRPAFTIPISGKRFEIGNCNAKMKMTMRTAAMPA
jgi:hypothetical protein